VFNDSFGDEEAEQEEKPKKARETKKIAEPRSDLDLDIHLFYRGRSNFFTAKEKKALQTQIERYASDPAYKAWVRAYMENNKKDGRANIKRDNLLSVLATDQLWERHLHQTTPQSPSSGSWALDKDLYGPDLTIPDEAQS
jgi:hypothetical protein